MVVWFECKGVSLGMLLECARVSLGKCGLESWKSFRKKLSVGMLFGIVGNYRKFFFNSSKLDWNYIFNYFFSMGRQGEK